MAWRSLSSSLTLLRAAKWSAPSSFLLIAVAATSGCSFLTSTSGLTGGEKQDAGDVAPNVTADAAAEGGQDVTPSDAAATRFCANVDASVCEDWDEDSGTRWVLDTAENATEVIDSVASSSPPRSLRVSTNTLATDVVARTFRSSSLPQTVKEMSYAMDVLVETPGQGGLVIAVMSASGSNDYATEIVLGENDDALEESKNGGNSIRHSLTRRIPVGKWTRVTGEITMTDAGYRARVLLDGLVALDVPLARFVDFAGGTPKLRVGAPYLRGPSSPWSVRLDNIVFDVK